MILTNSAKLLSALRITGHFEQAQKLAKVRE